MPSQSSWPVVLPRPDWENAGFGIYLHWPFCQAKCPYCDFNSHVSARIDQDRWAAAYIRELDQAANRLDGRRINSVYFGGGTPSLMSAETVAAVTDAIRRNWNVANDWEVTLEANPTSVEADRFDGYRQAGVNRLSLGVQSLNDVDLKRLGRLHTADEARHAFDTARSVFDRVSFDLIYARQDQSIDDWSAELEAALEMAIDHLSLYQLTVEPGTAFGARHNRGLLPGLPDEDLAADMYDLTLELCRNRGLDLYEISNFARTGSESKHNILYWSAGDYLGIGPGAHGRETIDGNRYATSTPLLPDAWLSRSESGQSGINQRDALSDGDQVAEYLMMGLRRTSGIDAGRLKTLGADTELFSRIHTMCEVGMLEASNQTIAVTERGRAVLNAILVELLPDA